VAEQEFGITAEIFYLNMAIAKAVGLDLYDEVAEGWHYMRGLGDWLFRSIAFPDIADNSDAYLATIYPDGDKRLTEFKDRIASLPAVIGDALAAYVAEHDLASYDLVGLTSMFSQNMASFAVARIVKESNPGALVIMGGANCEHPMGAVIAENVHWVDYVFSGPAITSFRQFLRCWQQDAPVIPIPGVLEHRGHTRPSLPLVTGSPAPVVGTRNDIDEPIPLDYDGYLAAVDHYFPDHGIAPALLFETSRGCWWGERSQCTFCGLNGTGMTYTAMSPGQAVAHISALFRYAGQIGMLEGVDNILPRSYVTDVLPLLQTPPSMSIRFEIKVGLTDRDLVTLARAGVREVQPGIESLATATLRLMRKGCTAFQNVMLLRGMRGVGIKPHWLLLVGFPGEQEAVYEKYEKDLPLLTHLHPPSSVFPVRFDRYSPYFDEREDYGLDLRPMVFYEFVYPFKETALADLAYYFDNNDTEAGYIQACLRHLGPLRATVSRWRGLWDRPDQAPPQLRLIEETRSVDGALILDSRTGQREFRAVSTPGVRLLAALGRPLDLAHASERAGLNSEQGGIEMRRLVEAGLVFAERGRYLSLVVDPYLSEKVGNPRDSGTGIREPQALVYQK
jgi:magnesium-protoporphyrin IX monomethyl ester (oxidative) cyclase